jgi:uncharacterized integral membrane protein
VFHVKEVKNADQRNDWINTGLILGIVFAIGAVTFALQNSVLVTVAYASWQHDSSLALVLLVAFGLGAIIAGLVSTPSMIKAQWAVARLRR